jgi:outer membrane receptor protein involved in Fe transport
LRARIRRLSRLKQEREWIMRVPHRIGRRLASALAWAVISSTAVPALGQNPGSIVGKVVDATSAEPVANASVVVDETGQRGTTGADGTFTFTHLAPGLYHVSVMAPGFASQRVEVAIASTATPATFELRLEPELHYTEVVSVSPDARDRFDAYQATSVLAGQDLAISLQGTLGAALQSQPGMAERSFGRGSARPVIRGMDGDRVLILEDGQRTGDLSSQSGDHGVNINPAAASRVEVVRGPATLLYGANASGGLVNVIQETIPTRPVSGAVDPRKQTSRATTATLAARPTWSSAMCASRSEPEVRGFPAKRPCTATTLSTMSFQSGQAASTITVRLDNATNELYRNHLSFIKDRCPRWGAISRSCTVSGSRRWEA